MNTRSFRRSKSATIAWANSARIAITVHGGGVRTLQFSERLLVLRVSHGQIMTIHRVLHVADAVALHGVGNDDHRCTPRRPEPGAFVPRGQERCEVVAVDRNDVKAEGAKLCV